MEHKNDLILRLRLGDRVITIGGASSPYRLLSSGFSGGEAAEAVTETLEHAQLDGALVLSRHVTGRDMTLLFEIADHGGREAYRSALLSFFDPTADGVLTVIRRDADGKSVTRSAACMLSGRVTMTQETLYSYIRVRVPLYCPDPYFFSDVTETAAARVVTPLLTCPLTVTQDAGLLSGLIRCSDSMTVRNAGDVPTGFLLQLQALDHGGTGTAGIANPTVTREEDGRQDSCASPIPQPANPTVTREEDGAYIRILTTLAVGDTLTVSTVPGAKYVLKNGENCLRFDRGSTFFPLLCGKNTLRITADAMPEPPDAVLSYRCRYFGA